MAERDIDILVYGATGFTGRVVAHTLSRTTPPIRLGLCGRNGALLSTLSASLPTPAVTLTADASSPSALSSAFSRARVVLNCAGPFATLGPPVLRAAVAARADYADVCGEPLFILRAMAELGPEARAARVLAVHACGFDSVPADMGSAHAARALCDAAPDGTTHIECFMRLAGAPKGPMAHVTTLQCALLGRRAAAETRRWRKALAQQCAAEGGGVVERPRAPPVRKGVFTDARAGGYATLFPGSDATVVRESVRAAECGRAGQGGAAWHSYAAYVCLGSAARAAWVAVLGAILFLVSCIPRGDALILRFPGVFTGGVFSRAGPTEGERAQTVVTLDFFATRYTGALATARAETRVTVRDPGYGATAQMVAACALTLLHEREKCAPGGVLAPSAAFRGTTLLDRLAAVPELDFETLRVEDV